MIINIKDLEIFANHGVLKEENILGQKFLVSIQMETNTVTNDNIENTINYAEVSKVCEEFLQSNTYALIETAALMLSRNLLVKYDKLNKVTVEIKKPWAPIKMNLDYVSVEVTSEWHTVYASFGSNMGDRYKHIESALDRLFKNENCKDFNLSKFIETKPVGDIKQEDFINGCVEFKTLLEPYEVLELFHEIENLGGRKREIHWGPRTIDLDILYFDDLIINTDTLTIPHKEIQNREFVLLPLSEIAPYKVHPLLKRTTLEMLNELV